MCRLRMAEDVDFDPDYQFLLDSLCQLRGLAYPPRNIEAADAMYLYLRTEMQVRLGL